jgi:hypothetical protein
MLWDAEDDIANELTFWKTLKTVVGCLYNSDQRSFENA